MIILSTSAVFLWIALMQLRVKLVNADNDKSLNKHGDEVVTRQAISSSYLIQFGDATDARTVSAIAVQTATKMQAAKQSLIDSGTLSMSSDVTNTQISPIHIFTESIRGFVLNGISEELSNMLLKIPNVIKVESDVIFAIHDVPNNGKRHLRSKFENTATLHYQHNRLMQSKDQIIPWGIQRIGGPIKSNPNPDGRVFIIDTGIAPVEDLNIDKDLSINFAGWNIEPEGPEWGDGIGHGTHIAGTVAALDNDINVVGLVPGAPVVAVRVIDDEGYGNWGDVIAGIEYVASNGKAGDVAILGFTGGFSDIVNAAVENAAAKGIKFAIAAGDFDDDAQFWSPASATGPNIYTVSCFDETDSFCYFSNYGSPVKFSGPGLNIESLSPDGGTVTESSTAMSSAHLAGLLLTGSIQVGGYVKCDKDDVPDPIAVASSGPISPTPAKAPSPNLTPVNQFEFKLLTDIYGDEVGWSLFQISQNNSKLIISKPAGKYESNQLYTEQYFLPIGKYQLNVTDEFGDGIQCPGYYTISLGGVVIKSGGIFENVDSTIFTVANVPSNQFLFTILTDGFASEDTAWTLSRLSTNNATVIASKDIGVYGNNMLYTEMYLLEKGTYRFNLTDAYGDGIIRPAYNTLTLGGIIIKINRPFTYIDSTTFTVGAGAPSPVKPFPKPKPAPTKPVPANPLVNKPVPNKPAPANPLMNKPAPANPLPNKPVPIKPAPKVAT